MGNIYGTTIGIVGAGLMLHVTSKVAKQAYSYTKKKRKSKRGR